MADEAPEPKQKTPKGTEIPIPTRDAFLRDLAKAAPKPANPQPEPDDDEQRQDSGSSRERRRP